MFEVVFFDYWKRGTRHFAGINKALQDLGITSILVHLGSERGEVYLSDEVIDGIICRDISFYENDLIKMLCKIKPKVVILLNNQTQDKIITRVSRGLGIKTIYLMHGVLALNNNVDAVIKQMNSAFGFKERIYRLVKYSKLIIVYLKTLMYNRDGGLLCSIFEIIKYFFIQFYSPASNLFGKYYYLDSLTNECIVYSERDKDNFIRIYKYPPSRVKALGNYNLDNFISRSSLVNISPRRKYLLYIENGFSDPKLTIDGWSESLVKDEIISLASIANKLEFDIYVKLHPSSDYCLLVNESVLPSNVKVFNDNLDELIANSSGVIGQSSSVIVMAIAIKKPICILNLEPLKLLIKDYVDDGIGTLVNNICEFENWLISLKMGALVYENNYNINYYYGPLDGKSTDRIVSSLLKIIKK
jgi:hypothetical protein